MDPKLRGVAAMNWGSWNDFWMMGGYGLYVWGSYATTLVLIVAEIALLRMRRRAAQDALRQYTGAQ
jgi:heme exporter protein D